MLFMDGGVTVSAVLGAAAVRLGLQEAERDSRELAGPKDLRRMRAQLEEVHSAVAAAHRALAEAWGGPLSLFDERAEQSALESGVPEGAIACVRKAQALIDEAAELGDRADVYETQLRIAESSGAGLLREPVAQLIVNLTCLAQRLSAHCAPLREARCGFDSPSRWEGTELAKNGPCQRQLHNADRDRIVDADYCSEAPMGILRERGAFGVAYRSVQKTGQKAANAVSIFFDTPPTLDAAPVSGRRSVEYSAYVADYL